MGTAVIQVIIDSTFSMIFSDDDLNHILKQKFCLICFIKQFSKKKRKYSFFFIIIFFLSVEFSSFITWNKNKKKIKINSSGLKLEQN